MASPTAFRLRAWYDTSNLDLPELPEPRWGVQAKVARRWAHCAKDDALLLFDTVEEAEAAIREMKERAGHAALASSTVPDERKGGSDER